MINIVGITLKVISMPFHTEQLKLCHFVAFLFLLLHMVLFIQILFKTDFCICDLQQIIDRIFPVTLKSFQSHLS